MERKSHRGRIGKVMGNEQFLRGMWEYFTLERAEARKILADASRRKQDTARKGSRPSEPREVAKLTRRWQRMKLAVWVLRRKL